MVCAWAESHAVSPALRLVEAPLGSARCDEVHRVLHLKGRLALTAVFQKTIPLDLGEKKKENCCFPIFFKVYSSLFVC